MTKVYVVTTGEYSDYSIHAIFSDRTVADKYCDVHNHGEDDIFGDAYIVEEWTLDAWDTKEVARKLYSASINLITGERVGQTEYWDEVRPEIRVPERKSVHWHGFLPDKITLTAESYVSPEHALKIAGDWRTKLLAERAEGIRDEKFNLIDEVNDED